MNNYWVTSAGLKRILTETSQKYINTSDRGKDKARSAHLRDVEEQLLAHASEHNERLPDDLQAVRGHFHIYLYEHSFIFI